MAGFQAADSTARSATCNANKKFVLIDVPVPGSPSNALGVVFAEEQSGFLAGLVAGQVSVSKKLGAVGGVDIPSVKRFINGFRLGVRSVCPSCSVAVNYTMTFVNENNRGVEAATAMMASGADVIFGCGGPTGSEAIKFAAAPRGSSVSSLTISSTGVVSFPVTVQSRNPAYVVGVDSDMWVTVFGSGATAGAERIVTSALKPIAAAARTAVASFLDGTFAAGTLKMDAANTDADFYAPCNGACASAGGPVTAAITASVQNAQRCLALKRLVLPVEEDGSVSATLPSLSIPKCVAERADATVSIVLPAGSVKKLASRCGKLGKSLRAVLSRKKVVKQGVSAVSVGSCSSNKKTGVLFISVTLTQSAGGLSVLADSAMAATIVKAARVPCGSEMRVTVLGQTTVFTASNLSELRC